MLVEELKAGPLPFTYEENFEIPVGTDLGSWLEFHTSQLPGVPLWRSILGSLSIFSTSPQVRSEL